MLPDLRHFLTEKCVRCLSQASRAALLKKLGALHRMVPAGKDDDTDPLIERALQERAGKHFENRALRLEAQEAIDELRAPREVAQRDTSPAGWLRWWGTARVLSGMFARLTEENLNAMMEAEELERSPKGDIKFRKETEASLVRIAHDMLGHVLPARCEAPPPASNHVMGDPA